MRIASLTHILHDYCLKMARYAVWSSVILANIGFILISVCIGTDYWVSRIRPSFETNEGLFFRCVKDIHTNGKVHQRCERMYNDLEDFPALYTAILSLMCGACLFHLITLIVSLLSCFLESSLKNVICGLEIASVMAAVAGLSAYVRFYNSKYYSFDWSYFIGWVGVFFVSVGIVLLIIGIERRKHPAF